MRQIRWELYNFYYDNIYANVLVCFVSYRIGHKNNGSSDNKLSARRVRVHRPRPFSVNVGIYPVNVGIYSIAVSSCTIRVCTYSVNLVIYSINVNVFTYSVVNVCIYSINRFICSMNVGTSSVNVRT